MKRYEITMKCIIGFLVAVLFFGITTGFIYGTGRDINCGENINIATPVTVATPVSIATEVTVATSTPVATPTKQITTNDCTIVENLEREKEEVVYKPSTHYIHKKNCHWVDDTCVTIEDTSDIEARKCDECNPEMEIENEYVVVTTTTTTCTYSKESTYTTATSTAAEIVEDESVQTQTASSGLTYVKNFSRGTYYAYGGARTGGSGRSLIDCSWGDGTVRGSIASSYLYNLYGYNHNGSRTMVYLEISGYSYMNGYYYLDDSDAGNSNVIDFFYYYGSNCQFRNQGVVSVDCYIVG